MSRPVEEHELSGLIDGELDAARAAEVRSAMERDPGLRAQFEQFESAHRTWTAAGQTARFKPAVQVEPPLQSVVPLLDRSYAGVAALVVGLAAVRLLFKFVPMDLAAAMLANALTLGAAIAAVIWIAERFAGGAAEPVKSGWPGYRQPWRLP